MNNQKYIQKTFVRQHDQQDCGVACLLSILRFYKGNATLEYIRELSGTHIQGTTMLGLVQASAKIGLNAKGLQIDFTYLQNIEKPVILHVIIDNRLPHFVVCYYYDSQKQLYCIGDPAKGIIFLSEQELNTIWQSKAIISLETNENFVLQTIQQKEKINYFLDVLKEDYPILIVSGIIGVIISILGLTVAIFSQKLLDDILPEKNIKKMIAGILVLFLVLLAKSFLGYLRGVFLNKQSRIFNNRLINSFLDKLIFLPLSFFNNRKTGDLIARLNDTRRIQQNISFLSGSLIIDILVIITSSFFVFRYHWLIGVVTLLSIPLYVCLAWIFSSKILVSQKQVMESYSRNESNYIDVIQGIRTIKSFQKENFFLNNTKNLYLQFQDSVFRLGIVGVRFNFLAEIIGVVLLTSIISLSCFLILTNKLKVGELMAVLSIIGTIIPAVIRISTANIPIQEAKIAFDRMYEFTSIPKEHIEEKNIEETQNIESIEVKNLLFRFVGRKPLFQNISFSAKKGEILGIVGENGSGKSTLFQILQGFYEIEEGKIYINQKITDSSFLKNIRNQIGIVPQDIKIFSGTVLENICLSNPQERYEDVIFFCKNLGLEKYFLRLPQGYFTIIGEQGVHLSGGQRQILALARALYQKPKILLLDEFNVAMDMEVATFSSNLLNVLKHEMIIISISHPDIPKLFTQSSISLS